MTTTNKNTDFISKSAKYGLQEFLDIISELSQESTKKGLISRLDKELFTYAIALYKNCHRCINIHQHAAETLNASEFQFEQVKKIILFMNATPGGDSGLWQPWVHNWQDYSYSKVVERRRFRELSALLIAIVRQHEKQIYLHLTAALDIGVKIEEIFELIPLAMLMDGAPALSQISTVMKAYESYQKSST